MYNVNYKLRYYKYLFFRLGKKFGIHKIWRPIYKILNKRKHPNNYNNILLENYNAVYFPIHKVAISTFYKIISEILYIDNSGKSEFKKSNTNGFADYYHTIDFPRAEIKNFDKYSKFAFVRNPYDRLISCYHNRILKDKISDGSYLYGVTKSLLASGNFYAGMSFKDFVKEIIKIPVNEGDVHFKPQYLFLTDKEGKLIPDFIGKFENLESDWEKICEKIGIQGHKLPHLMKSKHKHYSEYYDEETKKLVTEYYKKDLELFDYKF